MMSIFFRLKKKWILVLTLFVFTATLLQAQRDKEPYVFKDHLWYGINVGGLGIGNNTFSIGLAPMGGYRFNEHLSAGLIVRANYTYLWQRLGDNFSFLDYGAGALGRVKFLKEKYFAQVEYDIMNISTFNGVEQFRDAYPFFYIGGGMRYPGSGKWSSELTVLFNLHPDSNQLFFPLSLSYAFVYNF
jgi:hypothetical protein